MKKIILLIVLILLLQTNPVFAESRRDNGNYKRKVWYKPVYRRCVKLHRRIFRKYRFKTSIRTSNSGKHR